MKLSNDVKRDLLGYLWLGTFLIVVVVLAIYIGGLIDDHNRREYDNCVTSLKAAHTPSPEAVCHQIHPEVR
jgi:hypothetical protein